MVMGQSTDYSPNLRAFRAFGDAQVSWGIDMRAIKTARQRLKRKKPSFWLGFLLLLLAEWTGLEPATPGVTGRYSNQLNYHSSAAKTSETLASPRGFEPRYLP